MVLPSLIGLLADYSFVISETYLDENLVILTCACKSKIDSFDRIIWFVLVKLYSLENDWDFLTDRGTSGKYYMYPDILLKLVIEKVDTVSALLILL